MLFLDFGAAETSAVVGRPYGIHEIAFLIDARGSIIQHFAAPSGYAAFADLEWSNSPRYAVTLLEDSDRRPTTLAVLDAQTGITTPILSGSGLLQPSLWFGATDDSRPTTSAALRDSLFRYEEPFVHAIQGGFARKVRTFFTQAENLEIALVGSSHFENGLVSDRISQGRAVNLSISSTWHYTAEMLLKNYVVPHAPKLKAVVFNVLLGMFATNVGEPTLQQSILPSRGFRFDESHQFWRNGLPGELKVMATSLPQSGWLPTDSMGNYSAPSNGWGPEPIPLESWVVPSLDSTLLRSHQKVFIRIIQLLKSHGIAVLFVETPKHPGYGTKGNGYVSYIGPSVADAEKIHALIQVACSEYPRCALYDAHRLGEHDYVSEDFFDHDHLSRRGAEKLSTRIDSALVDLLSRQP
jgi:hypothetical protein